MVTLNFLNANIKSDTSLLTIVDIFSRMCRMGIDGKDEMFLFETGPVTQGQNHADVFHGQTVFRQQR